MISVDPITIVEGNSSTRMWSTTNAVTVTINGVSVATSGSDSVSPVVTTVYTLVATAAGGESAQDQATLTVNPVDPGVLSAAVIYYKESNPEASVAIPVTLVADAQGNQLYITASSTAGGPVTITPSGVPAGMSVSGGDPSPLWITFSGYGFGNEPAEGDHAITLALADGFGNTDNKILTIRKRVPFYDPVYKQVTRFVGAQVQGTAWSWTDFGAIKLPVSGTVTLNLKIGRQYEANQSGSTLTVQWYKDGVVWGAAQAGNATKSWDTTLEENRSYVIEARVLLATGEHLPAYRSAPSLFRVDNGTPKAGSYTVGVIEMGTAGAGCIWLDTQSSDQQSLLPNYITFPGSRTRRADDFPLTHVTATVPANDSERLALKLPSAWILEPTVPRDIWGHTVPSWMVDENDIVFLGQQFPRAGVETNASFPIMRKFADWCGPRGDNAVSEYSTFFPVPDGSWVGVQIDGRMFHRKVDGSVRTICGYAIAPASTVVPKDPRNANITAAQVIAHQETLVAGDFTGYGPGELDRPNDLCIDVSDASIVYVADTWNWRIAKVQFDADDYSFNNPVITEYCEFAVAARPFSLTQDTNGDLFVADRDLGKVYKVAALDQAITELCSITNAQAIRLNSLGQLIVAANATAADSAGRGKVYRVNKSTGAITEIIQTPYIDQTFITPQTWLWIDVDKWGNIGPTDAIYLSTSLPNTDATYGMGGQRSSVMVIYVNGSGDLTDADNFMIDCNGADFVSGRPGTTNIFDPFGHYPWAFAIHSHEARFITTGFGGVGECEWRKRMGGDPDSHAGDVSVYNRGRRIHLMGTVPDWPRDSRPSLAAIHGVRLFNYTGTLDQADDLNALSDVNLNTAIQAGLDSGVARPEITGDDLRDYRFFIRRNSLAGMLADVRPDSDDADTTAPTISSVVATPSGTQVTITWSTNESAIGYVEFGPDDYYGRHQLETDFDTTGHSEVITGLASGTYHYRVVAKDAAGNVTKDSDGTFIIA